MVEKTAMRSIEYTLKNNFLNQADYENIKNTILGEEFPWYFQYGVAVSKNIERASGEEEYLMGHTFFREHQGITSSFYKILDPILKKLKFKALIRIKANLYSNQGKIVEHDDHSDFPFSHKGALFSLNTCNGFTILKNNTKIKSVANRMLLFDPSTPHHSSTCTDAKMRCNININYF